MKKRYTTYSILHTRYSPHRRPFLFLLLCILLQACLEPSYDFPLQPRTPLSPVSSISSPPRIRIQVPFAPQAPFANWDTLHEEACEEASLILVHSFLEGQDITREETEREIQKLVAWETQHGYGPDVSLEQVKRIAEAYYGHGGRVLEHVSIDALKRELAQGQPVIVPLAGRDVGNPYYSGEGPWYHMLVITGYDEDEFIVNDVGTKRGKGYRYPYQTLLSAIHDWTGRKEEIRRGPKRALVLTKGN